MSDAPASPFAPDLFAGQVVQMGPVAAVEAHPATADVVALLEAAR